MEVSNLVRSSSFHSPSGSLQFRRSTSLGKLASPRPVKVHLGLRDSMELRRGRSETDLFQSGSGSARVAMLVLPVEEDEKDGMTELKRQAFTVQGMVPKEEAVDEMEEARESFGTGMGNGGNITNGTNGGQGSGDQSENGRFHDRYEELLRSDPGNPLLLRNYGKFLHEVEGNVKGAEECYGRAILASPGDGELLMLYGMLVWDKYREKQRAGAYLQKATEVSPHDCMVLAAYAKFLWEVGDDEDDQDTITSTESTTTTPFQPLVAAS